MPNADNRSPAPRIVTRFAPSPTGALHIGGARTALFNWLYTRHTGGKFLLRIEDTDRERSKPEHVAQILDSLQWLGISWDGEPLFQFARADRHREIAQSLLAKGRAYNCYLAPAELEAMREKAKAEGRPQVIESPWRDRSPAEAPSGIKPSLRLRSRRDGETVVDDLVQGRVVIPNKDLDDLIILRSDGAPTYNFAVVVDDHDMAVTHVIRGVDHLTNAARQTQIYQALDWPLPVFAHIPLVHGPDGSKLSKRHGAQGVAEYRAMGYLPAALRNYLVRLGWSHGNDEIFSTEQAIAWFDVADVGKSPGRFDFAKLADLNAHYIRQSSPADLASAIRDLIPHLPDGGAIEARFAAAGWDRLEAALPSLKERAKTLIELIERAAYLSSTRPLELDANAAQLLDAAGRSTLATVAEVIEKVNDWTAPALETAIRQLAESGGLKLGQVAQPLRAALTGRAVSPPVFDVMAVLGREESLARIREQTPP